MDNMTVQEIATLYDRGFITEEEYSCAMVMKAKVVKQATKGAVEQLHNIKNCIPEDVDTTIQMR